MLIDESWRGRRWVVETDIASCFSAIPHALLAPALLRRLLDEYVSRPEPGHVSPPPELTEREVEVLRLIGRGQSNSEIAVELFLSETTVKTHVTRIFTKLRLRDRA